MIINKKQFEITSMSNETKPFVFIIESLEFKNEIDEEFEGVIISKILKLSKITHKYFYIRTKSEFEHLLNEFVKSNYRYLHISCHGNENLIATTLDRINFKELGNLLRDKLNGKRLFLSSCESTNKNLANEIFPTSGCNSIIGSDKEISIDDAAIFWSSFYKIMFKRNSKAMKREVLESVLPGMKELFKIPIKYYRKDKKSKKGWTEVTI